LRPEWKEKFEFDLGESIHAVLMFDLRDKDPVGFKPICHYALPVQSIMPGYRIISLENQHGRKVNKGASNLFVHISFK